MGILRAMLAVAALAGACQGSTPTQLAPPAASLDELARRVDALLDAGVTADRLILDPGLGFSKRGAQNWALLADLDVLAALGYPILVGASRKRFLGALLPDGAPVEQRDLPTAVVSALAARAGVWGVRVHDVASTRVALDVAGAWQSGRRGQQS